MTEINDRLIDLGWNTAVAAAFTPYWNSHYPARACRVDRGGADLAAATGAVRATYGGALLRDLAADRSSRLAVGDWVAVRDWPDGRVTVEAKLARLNAIVRDTSDRTSHAQAVAANVDAVVIVEPLDPEPDPVRVERLLVLAWGSGAVPVVVLTKADLVPDPEGMRAEIAEVAPGVDVLAVDALTGLGVDALASRFGRGRTFAVLGPSGAGKSTLTNLFAGAEVMATGPARRRRGQHTTTHRELLVLPGRGVLVDTPGLRSAGLVASPDAIASAFPDIDDLSAQCRFRDCRHLVEPGCMVRAAVTTGDVDEQRLARWRKLTAEADRHARRSRSR